MLIILVSSTYLVIVTDNYFVKLHNTDFSVCSTSVIIYVYDLLCKSGKKVVVANIVFTYHYIHS